MKPDFKKAAQILDMAFSSKHQILGLVASDCRIFFYQSKDHKFHLVPLLVIDASELSMQTAIWYMEAHGVWLTSGKDNVLREWTLNSQILNRKETERDSYLNKEL